MHEIGHNLGLHHANEGSSAYEDQSGMMGYSYDVHDAPMMCFNAAKTWQLGWYSNKHATYDPLVAPSWTGKLVGPTDYVEADDSDYTIILKIERKHTTDLFLMFNRQEDFNSETQEGGDK
eukprot:12976524-Ditylum_brightwellii.AAC.1